VILGYHGIGSLGTSDDPLQLYVPPEGLSAQVRSLQRRGYEFVTMSEFADRASAAGRPPPGVAALTFDDGTVDHATVLPAVLEQLGVPGTVYVCPGLSGQPYPWASIEASVRFMTDEEMVELSAHPLIEIGAHTNEHRELHEADAKTALAEMTACKERLEAMLGVEIVSFCYPRCHYSADARASAPRAGFKSAVTCGLRGSWDLYELKREVLHSCDGPLVAGLRTRGRYSGLGGSFQARALRRVILTLDRIVSVVSRRSQAYVPAVTLFTL